MSILKKGSLYLIDQEFRNSCLSSSHKWIKDVEMAMPTAVATLESPDISPGTREMFETTLEEYGNKFMDTWDFYENGIVVLLDIENHGNTDKNWDICKIMFNNSNGVRYLYRSVLDLAKRISSS